MRTQGTLSLERTRATMVAPAKLGPVTRLAVSSTAFCTLLMYRVAEGIVCPWTVPLLQFGPDGSRSVRKDPEARSLGATHLYEYRGDTLWLSIRSSN